MINLQDKTILLLPVTSATFPSNLPRDDVMMYSTHLQLYLNVYWNNNSGVIEGHLLRRTKCMYLLHRI